MNYSKTISTQISDLKNSFYSFLDLYEHGEKFVNGVICRQNETSYSDGKVFATIQYKKVGQERGYEKQKNVYMISVLKRGIDQKVFETKKQVLEFLKTITE